MPRLCLLFLLSVMLPACAAIERLAIPNRALKDKSYKATGAQSTITHASWDRFLKTYTVAKKNGSVRLRYAAVIKQDHDALKAYIERLSASDFTNQTRNAQLAFWVNLYNAKTVDIILEHYPIRSIRNITNGLFDLGPWDEYRLRIKNQPTSLHDIEHGIIRPLWRDEPRIHYLLNCAAIGCPDLATQAYTAQNIQTKMQQAAIAFVNNPRGVRITSNNQIIVSKIYSWYQEDFGGSQISVLEHLEKYAAGRLKRQLRGRTRIDDYAYDWSLNDATTNINGKN